MNKKKNSLIFIISTIVIFGLGMLGYYFMSSSGGDQVRITVGGQEYGTYPLHKNQIIMVEQDHDFNKIEIKDGVVNMIESTCDNQICVHDLPISTDFPSVIVCLPHSLIVEIITEASE